MKLIFALSLLSLSVFANETCYKLGLENGGTPKTPHLLCVDQHSAVSETAPITAVITLKLSQILREREVAVYKMDLVKRVRSIIINQDEWGLVNPENSLFNQLKIIFNGRRSLPEGTQSGTVTIGNRVFTYQSL